MRPSGSGKSTLIKTINGLEPFQKGEILLDGISVGAPSTNLPKLRSRIGMVFQNFELFPHMSVLKNVTIAQVKVLGRQPADAQERAFGEIADQQHALGGGHGVQPAPARAVVWGGGVQRVDPNVGVGEKRTRIHAAPGSMPRDSRQATTFDFPLMKPISIFCSEPNMEAGTPE